jgi:hypothetical protein
VALSLYWGGACRQALLKNPVFWPFSLEFFPSSILTSLVGWNPNLGVLAAEPPNESMGRCRKMVPEPRMRKAEPESRKE